MRLGIDSQRLTWLAFVISGFLTGIGGLMLAGQVGIGSPSTGTDYTLMSITVVVLGGASVSRRARLVREHPSRRCFGASDLKRVVLHQCQFVGALHRDRRADLVGRDFLQHRAAAQRDAGEPGDRLKRPGYRF